MSDLIQLHQIGEKLPHHDAELFRERVADLLNSRSKAFPGAQPVSFAKQHFEALCESDYFLCEKTDGIRCLLYLTFIADDSEESGMREAAFLIDRKNDYYHINQLHFPVPGQPIKSFHIETLADGELVLDVMPDGRKVRRYLVFDCLALDKRPLLTRTLDKRLGYFQINVLEPQQDLLKKFPDDIEYQPFEIAMKRMEKAYGLEMMFREVLPNLPHGNDGLVFTKRESNYTIGTDPNIIKWKPPHENTIDFRLQVGMFPPLDPGVPLTNGQQEIDGHPYQPDYDAPPELALLVNHGSRDYRNFAALHVTQAEWDVMKGLNQQLDERIIECYKDRQGRWRFKKEKDGSPRFRDDKTDANHISTVNSVLSSIEDGVSEQDLLARDVDIKNAWKVRDARVAREAKEAAERERQRREAAERERAEREKAERERKAAQ
ncbi:hypothetical protein MBLNU457_6470t1 [Dothideomycetes sp. NU457]